MAGEGLDESLMAVERTDGTTQVTYNDWPLYLFSGDAAAGDTNGQGVGDVARDRNRRRPHPRLTYARHSWRPSRASVADTSARCAGISSRCSTGTGRGGRGATARTGKPATAASRARLTP